MKRIDKLKEYRGFNIEELSHQNDEFKKELLNLRFQLKTGQLRNIARIKEIKKDIARLQTIIIEKKISSAKGS